MEIVKELIKALECDGDEIEAGVVETDLPVTSLKRYEGGLKLNPEALFQAMQFQGGSRPFAGRTQIHEPIFYTL